MGLDNLFFDAGDSRWQWTFVLLAVLFVWLVLRWIYHTVVIQNWPAADGIVTVSTFDYSVIVPVEPISEWRPFQKTRSCYAPQIEYQYTVGDQKYTGTRIAYGTLFRSRDPRRTEQMMKDFAVGRPVTVFYNPHDPAESCLSKTVYFL